MSDTTSTMLRHVELESMLQSAEFSMQVGEPGRVGGGRLWAGRQKKKESMDRSPTGDAFVRRVVYTLPRTRFGVPDATPRRHHHRPRFPRPPPSPPTHTTATPPPDTHPRYVLEKEELTRLFNQYPRFKATTATSYSPLRYKG